jgi:hypothetical protein
MTRHLVAGMLLGTLLGAPGLAAEGRLELPPAILAECAPPNSALPCEDVQNFLDAMNAETRHDSWAKPMEARIRKAMRVNGKQHGQIRELQCRRARCVLVFSVAEKDAEATVDGDESLDKLMDLRTFAVGHEASPDAGPASVVILRAWQKRVIIEDTAKPENAVDARE